MHHLHPFLEQPQTILLALGAAVLFALTSVLQHSAAGEVEARHSMRPRLVIELSRRPRWLLGNLTDVTAFALQFLALRHGSLLVVQPLLTTGLLFTLPLAAMTTHRRLGRSEWVSAVALVLSLSTFLIVANPTRGRPSATGMGWLTVGAGAWVVIAALLVRAPAGAGRSRARHLGAVCGVLFALTAALTKESGHVLDQGLGHALTSWEPYAWAAVAGFGFLVAQSALHAGPLNASMPLLVVADPLAAAFIGVVAFQERIVFRPVPAAAAVGAIAVMVLAAFNLARSPLVSGSDASSPPVPG